jgi:hypothetical protein
MRTIGGTDRITLERGSSAPEMPSGTALVKLSPRVRIEPLEGDKPPTMRFADIAAMLGRPYVLDREAALEAPYVLSPADDQRFLAGRFEHIFVRGPVGTGTVFDLVRDIRPLRGAKGNGLLGYEAEYVGTARLVQPGDPSTFVLTESASEVRPGDRLVPVRNVELPLEFTPLPPARPVDGHILSVYKGISEISQYNVVSIDLGSDAGMRAGDLLAIFQAGSQVRDPVTGHQVRLPDQRAGLLLVFKPFEKVSYGLVLEAERSLHVLDRVASP